MPDSVDHSPSDSDGDASIRWVGDEPLLGRVTGELPSWEASVVDRATTPASSENPSDQAATAPRQASQPNYGGTGVPAATPPPPSYTAPSEQPRRAEPHPAPQPQPQNQSLFRDPGPAPAAQRPAPSQVPLQQFERGPSQTDNDRSSSRVGLIAAAVIGVLAVIGGAFALTRGSGDDTTSGQGEISASPVDNPVEEITNLLQDIGYNDVSVELAGDTLLLTGEVESRADLAAVVTASTSLADGYEINTDGLGIAPAAASPESGNADVAAEEPMATNPLRLLQVAIDRTVAKAPIIFEPTITDLSPWHSPTLDEVANILLANPGIAVSIVGYTDESGRSGEQRGDQLRPGVVRAAILGFAWNPRGPARHRSPR